MGILLPVAVAIGAVAVLIVLINQVPAVQDLVLGNGLSNDQASSGDVGVTEQAKISTTGTPQVKILSVSLDTTGSGEIVLSNNGSAADVVKKVEVKNAGVALDNGESIVGGLINAKSAQHTVTFYIGHDGTFRAPSSGQQVTAVISLASGTTIAQTLTVVAASTPQSSSTIAVTPQVRIQSMSIDSYGHGRIVMSNTGTLDDQVVAMETPNVGTAMTKEIWLVDGQGFPTGAAVIPANSNGQEIYFDISRGSFFSPPASGQQVTSIIKLASGSSITQVLTVTAPEDPPYQLDLRELHVLSMSLDTEGHGAIVFWNGRNADDRVVKVDFKNVGTASDSGTGTRIWRDDGQGNHLGPAILGAHSLPLAIGFNLDNDGAFYGPSSGQQVTATITMASGTVLTQTITAVGT